MLWKDDRTGRVLVYEERNGRDVLVGSMPPTAKDEDFREICRRLTDEAR